MNHSYIRNLRKPSPSAPSSSQKAPPYLYRKEVFLQHDPNAKPSLTVTQRLKQKENLIFGGAPNFKDLKSDDRSGKNTSSTMSFDEMKEFSEQQKKKEERKKKNKKDAPTPNEIREHLRLIVKYHKKEVEELMPTAYPLLGPAGKNDEDDDDDNTLDSKKGTSQADTQRRTIKESSGRKKKIPCASDRCKPPKKRGKK